MHAFSSIATSQRRDSHPPRRDLVGNIRGNRDQLETTEPSQYAEV
jgi:hypothetical protein